MKQNALANPEDHAALGSYLVIDESSGTELGRHASLRAARVAALACASHGVDVSVELSAPHIRRRHLFRIAGRARGRASGVARRAGTPSPEASKRRDLKTSWVRNLVDRACFILVFAILGLTVCGMMRVITHV